MVRVSKIIKFLICLEIGLFVFINTVNAETNPYNKMQTIEGVTTVSCTWFAWQEAYERIGVELPRWGNAVNWYERASLAGFSVGSIAKTNSIAVWQNSNNVYGHIAYVTNVNGTTMTINEGGLTTLVVSQETNEVVKVPYNGNGIYYGNVLSLSNKRSETSFLLGFIYLSNEDENLNNQNNEFEELVLVEENIKEENNINFQEPLDKQREKKISKQEDVNNSSSLESNKKEVKKEIKLDNELSDELSSKINCEKVIDEFQSKENKDKIKINLKQETKKIKHFDSILFLRRIIILIYTILLAIIKISYN